QRLGQRLLGQILGEFDVAGVAGEPAHDPGGLAAPHRLDGATDAAAGHSWPVSSRQARSLATHSLSCGNSSMVGMRRISILLPRWLGARLAHSIASSLDATSMM